MWATRSTLTRRAGLGSVILATGALLVAGCSSSSKSVSTTAGASPTAAAGASSTVLVRSTKLGSVLTDASGKTLYTFDKDTAGATTSACTGGCASAWPPLTATGTPTAGPGVSGTLATISGGQVTWNGHPLYLWMGDQAAGDTTGDGVNGFHAAMAAGGAGGSGPATTSAPTTAKSGGGYGGY
jgi:predicted lipoprotein with Yx(FWY)xxD motif